MIMRNLLAVIILGSISLSASANDEIDKVQYDEIDVSAINLEQLASLDLDRKMFELALDLEQNARLDLLLE
jgi:hypothetical protein